MLMFGIWSGYRRQIHADGEGRLMPLPAKTCGSRLSSEISIIHPCVAQMPMSDSYVLSTLPRHLVRRGTQQGHSANSVHLGGLGRGAVCHLCWRRCGILPSSMQKFAEGAMFIGVELGDGGYIIRRNGVCAGKFFSLFSFVLFGGTWRHIRRTLIAHRVEVPVRY